MDPTKKRMKRVILTGPECTAKTTLTINLSKRFHSGYITEYAREYIENLKGSYTYEDVVHIALKQVEMMNTYSGSDEEVLFIDTYLIITKIWFKRVFGKMPDWIDEEIHKTKDDLYLLCQPDIPWKPDKVRENGGEARQVLFREYEDELKAANLHYNIIGGIGIERIENAIKKVEEYILQDYEKR